MAEKKLERRSDWIDLLLFILAIPFLVVRLGRSLRRDLRRIETIQRGTAICSSGHATNLTRMAKCPVCAAVKPTNLLHCPTCSTSFDAVPCESCGETVFI